MSPPALAPKDAATPYRSHAVVRILALVLLVTLLPGCVGQVTFQADEEVTPGAALGFTSIDYVSELRPAAGSIVQDIIAIDAVGKVTFVRNVNGKEAVRQPSRFLPDEKLLEVRRNFASSDFFTWADSIYGTPPGSQTRTINFEVGDQRDVLIRYDEAPVPEQIEVLMEQMAELLIEAQFGQGDPLEIEPVFEGRATRIDRRDFVVVRNEEALLRLLFRMGSIELSVLPRIDYAREMLACVFLGDESGSTLEVRPVEAFSDGRRVQLLYARRDAGSSCSLSARPFFLAKLPRVDATVEFFEASVRDTVRCERE